MSPQAIRDESGRVQAMIFFESELCERLDVGADQLREWEELFKPEGSAVHPDRETREPVYRVTVEQLHTYAKYAKILKTGMTPTQVRQLEERDKKASKAGKPSNFLEMYALLSEECPPGVTAHALRSYCVVFLYQNRGNKMLLGSDLAKVADIPEETAKRHLMWLQAAGLLRLAQNPTRWEFSFVPKALSKYYR